MAGLTWIEIIYWAATIIGGTLFVLRLIMMFMGTSAGEDALDSAIETSHPADTDLGFKLMSIQGLTSFFMMFGLVGLALLRASLPVLVTVLGGIIAGLATVAVTGLIFSQMKKLQTDGTIQIENTVGKDGSVYLTVPQNGTGQVQIIVQGSLKIFDAMSNNKSRIATGEKVRVVGVASGNTLIVEKI
jgi:hypothetical protein